MRESLFVLPQTAEYAVRALGYIAETGGAKPVRARDIALATAIPHNYLSKTLNQLGRAGILTSVRGPAGGFKLAFPASEISFNTVLRIFAPQKKRHCLLGGGVCGERPECAVHQQWQPLAVQLRDFLSNTTIANVVSAPTLIPEAPKS